MGVPEVIPEGLDFEVSRKATAANLGVALAVAEFLPAARFASLRALDKVDGVGVVPNSHATGSGYLISDSRIARYEQHLDRLQENGYQDTEKLGEYSGRINMLKEGYVLAGDGKLVGNKLTPGNGKGTQGIDRIYSNVDDPYDYAILESKYRTTFTDGQNPLTLLPQTKRSGQQMSTPWIMNNINKMTGPNQGVRLNILGDNLLLNGYNNRHLNVLNGNGQRFMFNLDNYGVK